jgi:hypothetical protein
MNTTYIERMERLDIRFDQVIHIPTQCLVCYAWDDDVTEVFKDYWTEVWGALGIAVGDEEEEGGSEVFRDILRDNNVTGFLVKAATPAPVREGEGCRVSWSCWPTKWLHAETLEEAVDKAETWRNDYRRRVEERFDKERKEEQDE